MPTIPQINIPTPHSAPHTHHPSFIDYLSYLPPISGKAHYLSPQVFIILVAVGIPDPTPPGIYASTEPIPLI